MAATDNAAQLLLDGTSPRIVPVALPTNITADWTTNVTGTGKPANYATVNRVQRGASFAGTPIDGDIWIDTSVTPNVIKTRVSGAWQIGANYTTDTNQLTDGAGLGTTATWASVTGAGKPSNNADVTATILGASGTSIVMTNANLFKSASGTAGVFIGSGGLIGKNASGVTTFSIDGSTGAATFAGSLSAATGSFGAVTAGGAVTVNSSGSISNGISYGGTGFFLGYSGSAYKFSLGDATKYLRWDGSTLTFTGALSGATGTFSGTVSASNISGGTFTGASIAIGSSAGGSVLNVVNNGTIVYYRRLEGYNIYAGNLASPSASAIEGSSGSGAAGVYGNCAHISGHGVRGEAGDGLGFVGYAGGSYDFYAYGAASNYGPFTGAHDALIAKGTALQPGDIVCDVTVAVRKNVSNTLCIVVPSTAAGQGAAVGVMCNPPRTLDVVHDLPAAMVTRFWTTAPDGAKTETLLQCPEWYDLRLTHDAITMNALGEGQINVCGLGGNLQPGDLITTSALPGKGQRQADDVVRASSVAKCREAVTFDFPEQVKQVACIYLCG